MQKGKKPSTATAAKLMAGNCTEREGGKNYIFKVADEADHGAHCAGCYVGDRGGGREAVGGSLRRVEHLKSDYDPHDPPVASYLARYV